MIRNRWNVGSYLMRDDLSGLIRYREDMVQRWDGIWMERAGNEEEIERHPQEFIRALMDPKALFDVRPREATSATNITYANYVTNGNVILPVGAAQHLFPTLESGIGIGQMVIGGDTSANRFFVR